MICPKQFLQELSKYTTLISGVPDSALKGLSDYLEHQEIVEHVKVPNEGIALSYSAGYYMATQKPGLVYLQNSGFGNIVNPLTSLVDELVYSIPCVILVGWRAYKGSKDEPQHRKMGLITQNLVETMGYHSIELNSSSEWKQCLNESFRLANSLKSPVFLLAEPKVFDEIKKESEPKIDLEPRELVLSKLYDILNEHTIVSTTGKSSRELYEVNSNRKSDIFYSVGSMGHASSIALALSRYSRNRITCIDGDGAFLMHMGFLAMIKDHQAENFNHIVINNGLHESVGNQATLYKNVDIISCAKASGYRNVISLNCKRGNIDAVLSQVTDVFKQTGPNLIELNVGVKTRADLSRPKETPKENLAKFMDNIR